ncbi:hypothetical protein M3Y99_00374500 [Aphelenchoides fujianensis]|nr:hypothetical protein M3Y99_00374500 [Aphelenchoides fujianensis]
MSAATAPTRRKQRKPKKLAATGSDDDEDVVPAKRVRDSPLSIEERFKNQFSSLEGLFQGAKTAASTENGAPPRPFDLTASNLSAETLLHRGPAARRGERDFAQVDGGDAKPAERVKADVNPLDDLLLAAQPKGGILLGSWNPQQILQLYNAVGQAQLGAEIVNGGHFDGEEAENAAAEPSRTPPRNSETPAGSSSCLLSPPNSFHEDVRHSSASSASTAGFTPLVCAVGGCGEASGRPFANSAAYVLHLAEEHADANALHCGACDERRPEERAEEDARSTSEPPNADRPWAELRLCDKNDASWNRNETTRASSIAAEPPVLTSEEPSGEQNADGLSGVERALKVAGSRPFNPLGFPGVLPARPEPCGECSGELLRFHAPSYPPTIPQFVPPSSSHTPPRNGQQRGGSANPEDDWESMMEISNIDETEKIRALVGDKALPTTDPNQCLLCRRILSCKISPLQMHYRTQVSTPQTHGGEAVSSCKICQRAFTTKGNLKTHMGVHRAKHSLRGVGSPAAASLAASSLNHQCPICQKRFFSPQLLQQHIQEHTQQLARNTLIPSTAPNRPAVPNFAQLFGGEKKPPAVPSPTTSLAAPAFMPHGLPPGFPPLPFLPARLPRLRRLPVREPAAHFGRRREGDARRPARLLVEQRDGHGDHPKRGRSVRLVGHPALQAAPNGRAGGAEEGRADGGRKTLEESSTQQPKGDVREDAKREETPASVDRERESKERSQSVEITNPAAQPPSSSTATPATSGETPPTENPLAAIQKMWAAAEPTPPVRPPIQLSKHQCAVCFKHFSSSSALQIHMRTHSTHSYQTSPSRRGRRIFDFGTESLLRMNGQPPPAGLPPFAAQPPASGAPPFGFPAMSAAAMAGGMSPFFAALAALNKNAQQAALVPNLGGESPAADPSAAMLWLFKTTCSVCSKVCQTPQELQKHLATHIDADSKETSD